MRFQVGIYPELFQLDEIQHGRLAAINDFDPYPTKLIYLNFQPLEVVSRYRTPQPQVVEKYSYLFNFRPNIPN